MKGICIAISRVKYLENKTLKLNPSIKTKQEEAVSDQLPSIQAKKYGERMRAKALRAKLNPW